ARKFPAGPAREPRRAGRGRVQGRTRSSARGSRGVRGLARCRVACERGGCRPPGLSGRLTALNGAEATAMQLRSAVASVLLLASGPVLAEGHAIGLKVGVLGVGLEYTH